MTQLFHDIMDMTTSSTASTPSPAARAVAGVVAVGAVGAVVAAVGTVRRRRRRRHGALVVSTWRFGAAACEAAGRALEEGRTAVDAVEEGVSVVEMNENIRSYVGFGGLPNEQGEMEHDAGIMDGRTLDMGCVMGLKDIPSPIRVARCVLDKSPHSVFVGDGATRFANTHGFPRKPTMSAAAAEEYETHRRETQFDNVLLASPFQSDHNDSRHSLEDSALDVYAFLSGAIAERDGPGVGHDTVGVIAMDASGNFCVGTSSSGPPFCPEGRAGDAAVVGAGFYADNDVGAAAATGDATAILKTCLCFLVVQYIRGGDSPTTACRRAVAHTQNVHRRPHPQALSHSDSTTTLDTSVVETAPCVSVVAVDVSGQVGAATTIGKENPFEGQQDATTNPSAFQYAVYDQGNVRIHEATACALPPSR